MNKKTKVQMNRIYPFVVSVIAIIVMIIIYVLQIKFEPLKIIEYSGYAVTGSQITENLLNKKYNNENNEKIEALKVEEQSMLYKSLNKYYIGQDKASNININYPIYINDNVAIYSLAEDSEFITTDFEEEVGYPNITIADGILYNGTDLTRADMNEYILIKNNDKIFINTREIGIQTILEKRNIKMNSIIYFTEEYIAFYEMEDGYFIYNKIDLVDYSNIMTLGDIEITYGEFLENLNLKTHKKELVQNEVQTEENVQEVEPELKEDTADKQDTENEQKEETKEEVWKKPEVTCGQMEASVYTARINVFVKDESAAITKPVTFTFMKGEKTQFRTTVLESGDVTINGLLPETEYTVIGIYQYKDEEGNKKQVEFTRQTIKTNSIDSLKPIILSFENGEVFSNKIQIKNLKIVSDLNAEAIRGIKKAGIKIGAHLYNLTNSEIQKLKAGEELLFETSEVLKSNSKFEYEIKFYDSIENEIKLENNKGETKTYKQKPTVTINQSKQNITSVEFKIDLKNKDDVKIENYRYEVINSYKQIVASEKLTEGQTKIEINNLNEQEVFTIKVYADIDEEDGKGTQKDIQLGNYNFTTAPINNLGYINAITEQQELTSNNIKINFKIDQTRTDHRLIPIINKITIKLYKQESDELLQIQEITGEELDNLKASNFKLIEFSNLDSYTKYRIEIKANAVQGSKNHEIQSTYSLQEFITKKANVEVQLNGAPFVNENMIDLEFKIFDKDGAVLNENVMYILKDANDKIVQVDNIKTNGDYFRQVYDKLEINKTYKIHFYAEQYNIENDNSGYETNFEFETMTFTTEAGISGSINLIGLEREKVEGGKNLVDVESTVKWYSNCWDTSAFHGKEYDKNENTLKLYFGNVFDVRSTICL